MSGSFSPEEKERLIADIEGVRKDANYVLDQIQSAILQDLDPSDPAAFSRVIAMMSHFFKRLVGPADTLNLLGMEKDLG